MKIYGIVMVEPLLIYLEKFGCKVFDKMLGIDDLVSG
jgi:hypothetical protein